MNLESFIESYGYLATFIGTFLEGEMVLVLSGFVAHQGYLSLPFVLLAAFSGTLLGDQLFYYLGRHRGQPFLDKRPVWKAKSQRILEKLRNNEVKLILGFRFLYGFRTVTPFVIGLSGVRPLRYLVLNVIGAAIWAATIGLLGYFVGASIEALIGRVHRYEKWVVLAILGLGAIFWAWRWFRDRRIAATGSQGHGA